MKSEIINEVYQIININKEKSPDESYSARIFKDSKGKNKILEKLIEEATETIIAAKDEDKKEIIYEMADLWFHCLVLLSIYKITPDQVFSELIKRSKRN